jgi:hypothetical protein
VSYPPLNVGDHLPGRGLVPAPVQLLGGDPELDNKIPRQILRLNFSSFFPPQPDQRLFVTPHNDPGVRAPMKERRSADLFHMAFFISLLPGV